MSESSTTTPPRAAVHPDAGRVHTSAACRRADLLHGVVLLAADVAGRFAADHPDGCDCLYCGWDTYAEVNRSVRAAGHVLHLLCNQFDAECVGILNAASRPGGTAGDRLRELARWADRADAAAGAEAAGDEAKGGPAGD